MIDEILKMIAEYDPEVGEAMQEKARQRGNINALISADLAIRGMVVPIPPDQVLEAMYKTGKLLPEALRETAQGGIAATARGKEIAEKIICERKLGRAEK